MHLSKFDNICEIYLKTFILHEQYSYEKLTIFLNSSIIINEITFIKYYYIAHKRFLIFYGMDIKHFVKNVSYFMNNAVMNVQQEFYELKFLVFK